MIESNLDLTSSNAKDYIEKQVDSTVDSKIDKKTIMVFTIAMSVLYGFLVSVTWDIYGKVYEVSGKQYIQYEIIKELKLENQYLKGKNFNLQQKILNNECKKEIKCQSK
jgi:hypothetical protein